MDNPNDVSSSFSALVAEAGTFFSPKKKTEVQTHSFNVKLKTSVKELKIKGFKEALGEALRYLFYVSYALSKGEVKRSEDSFDSTARIFETISPALSSIIPSENRGFKTDLAFGMLNLLFEVIRAIKDENAKIAADRIVKAFQGGYGRINVEQLKSITKNLAHRFQDQINQMTISISTDGKLRMHESDGVVKFANVIAKRIGTHIMKGRNEYVDEKGKVVFFQGLSDIARTVHVNLQLTFSEAQNIQARLPLPTLERCLLATWQEIDGHDVLIESDTLRSGSYLIWMAGDILTHSGIRNIRSPNEICERKDHFSSNVGYIYAAAEEAKERGYEQFRDIQKNTQQQPGASATLATPK